MPAEVGMERGAACRRTRGKGCCRMRVEVTWSVTGQRGKEQVGREAVDDASGCEREEMIVRNGGRKK